MYVNVCESTYTNLCMCNRVRSRSYEQMYTCNTLHDDLTRPNASSWHETSKSTVRHGIDAFLKIRNRVIILGALQQEFSKTGPHTHLRWPSRHVYQEINLGGDFSFQRVLH